MRGCWLGEATYMRRARKETHNFSSGFSAGVFVLYIWRNVTGKYGIERKARSPGNRTRPSRFWYGIVGVIGTSREKGIALYGEGRRGGGGVTVIWRGGR